VAVSDILRSTERVPAATDGAYSRLLRQLEDSPTWDRSIGSVAPLAERLLVAAPLRRLFRGEATGAPLHVILTDAPLGAWFMAQFLDLFRDDGSRRAATRLIGLGVTAAVPTAVAGWAEWAGSQRAARRVGMTHASLTGLATLLVAASWAARLQGRHRLGVAAARAGSLPLLAGAFLGAHVRRLGCP
jgi:hypothetical protein